MAAPVGNQFWKLRSKHGRDRLFSSAAEMWEAATEYFNWCEEHPLMETDYRGKDADEVAIPHMRPFTMQGLCFYLHCNTDYFSEFKQRLNPSKNEADKDFAGVIKDIEQIVYMQKFEGAAVGFLNANLISRDLGLKDNMIKEVTMKKKTVLTLKLTDGPGNTGNRVSPASPDQQLP